MTIHILRERATPEADWDPLSQEVHFDALINIRPRQNNRTMVIKDPEIRQRVDSLIRWIFSGVQ